VNRRKTAGSWLFGAFVALGALIACTSTPKAKEDKLCTAGNYVFCRCKDRQEGSKLCKDDSASFGPCEPCETADNPEVPLEEGEEARPVDPPVRRDGGGNGGDDSGNGGAPKCGDNIVQDGEDCDDKNTNETDGCDKNCRLAGTAPQTSNACPGLKVHVWGGAHKPTLVATTVGSGNRSTATQCNAAGNTATSGSVGPDRVFEVVAHKSGQMTAAVTETNFNAYVYAADTCPTNQVTYIACSNKVDGNGNETITFPVETGKSYFVFVDGTLPTSSGDFRVTFSIP
jgi:cysteine-rich repeat protein